MDGLTGAANEFIVAYYRTLVFAHKDLSKFYNEDTGSIWRTGGNGRQGAIAFPKAKRELALHLGKQSSVKILSYAVLPISQGGMSIVVNGEIVDQSVQGFNQCFTLSSVQDRLVIDADVLTITAGATPSTEGKFFSVPALQ